MSFTRTTLLLTHNTFFDNKKEIILIPYRDILVFPSSKHYIDILTTTESYSHYLLFNNILIFLPIEFIRCHRCYIVNINHIYKIVENTIVLSNNMKITIGRSYRKQVRTAFCKYSIHLN